jgi:hypothetical protein
VSLSPGTAAIVGWAMSQLLENKNETLNYKPKQECDEFTGALTNGTGRIYLRVVIFS